MELPVTLICDFCKESFLKAPAEYRRQVKKGRSKFYCNLACAGRENNRVFKRPGNLKNLRANNRRDPLTPLRWFMGRIRYRNHKGTSDLTLRYLEELWNKQQGKCPFTGWDLILPNSTKGWTPGSTQKRASLDRINNKLGYVQGNVRFVALMANYARNIYTDEELLGFCTAVVNTAVNTA